MKRAHWAAVPVLLAGLLVGLVAAASGAAAETATDRARLVETSSGECHSGTCFGYSLRGEARGDLPGTLFLVISYTPDHFGPGVTNTIVGHWVLDVSETDSLFGSITEGTIEWNRWGPIATITAEMTIDAGQGAFQGTTGTGSFDGRLWNLPGRPDRARGVLTLDY